MTYSSEVLADSPALYWRLGESSGTTAVDSSGNGRNGTYINTPTLGVEGAPPRHWDGDTAVTFTAASSEEVTISFASWMTSTSATYEAWYKGTGTGQVIFGRRHTTSTLGYIIVNGSGTATFQSKRSNNTNPGVVGTTTINDGNWHHIVGVADGQTLRIYVDGVQENTNATGLNIGTDTTVGMAVASRGANFIDGSVDEAAFYPTALNAARIAIHYDAGTVCRSVGSITDLPSALLAPGDESSVGAQMERLALVTVLGNDASAGTEVSGSGYARQTPTWLTHSGSGYVYMSNQLEYRCPTGNVLGWEAWNSAGSTRRTYGLFSPTTCVASASANSLALSGYHGTSTEAEWPDGTKIVFHPNHCPSGLTAGTVYYIRDSDGYRFKVAATAGGTAIDITADTLPSSPSVFGRVITIPVAGASLTVDAIAVRASEIGVTLGYNAAS